MNRALPARDVTSAPLLVCFSHLRWDLVVQRPHHLLRRAAKTFTVVYFEEPVREDVSPARLRLRTDPSGVMIATPVVPHGDENVDKTQRRLLDDLLASFNYGAMVAWYYTPMALSFTSHLQPDVCVYDCMDELSAFRNAPKELHEREAALLRRADLVFTGGRSLYEAKRSRHAHAFCFPSSIEVPHFAQARSPQPDPDDQRALPHPRIGFVGVIDERMDLELVAEAAAALPRVQFVMLGPVVKIDPAERPQAPNLHWLGPKHYTELPAYLANWQAAWMPFALNESTRYISPTKTPEFLAAGLPVTSTAVPDVVKTYGEEGLVRIADRTTIAETLAASLGSRDADWLAAVDASLARTSWDRTWASMNRHITRHLAQRTTVHTIPVVSETAGSLRQVGA